MPASSLDNKVYCYAELAVFAPGIILKSSRLPSGVRTVAHLGTNQESLANANVKRATAVHVCSAGLTMVQVVHLNQGL